MGVSIGQAKHHFASIIEGLYKEPPLLSQFAVWLDMRLCEYKLQGGMKLDYHEVVSNPDWMQGIKCRCMLNANIPKQAQAEFGSSAWLFPRSEGEELSQKRFPSLDSNGFEGNTIKPEQSTSSGDTHPRSGYYNNSTRPPCRGPSKSSNSKPDRPSSAASNFLSDMAISARIDRENDEPVTGMSLPLRHAEPSPKEHEQNDPGGDVEYDVGDYIPDSPSDDGGDVIVHDTTEMADDYESMPRIISVTSVEPDGPLSYATGIRRSTKGKQRLDSLDYEFPAKKSRIVRNYTREFKLRVVSHSLKYGTRSACIIFGVAKTNVQRWTSQVTKRVQDCGIEEIACDSQDFQRAEEGLVTWVRETYKDSGPPTVTQLQNMASLIFGKVNRNFEPAYLWILNFLGRYKLARYIDLPCEFDESVPVTTDEVRLLDDTI